MRGFPSLLVGVIQVRPLSRELGNHGGCLF
nr:MAG TPA: hypothetical protein [Caudoviricetes sp.]